MRKLKCFQVAGLNVQEILDEFNERAKEFAVSESDILSVSVLPATTSAKIPTPKGKGTKDPKVEVVIVYWEKAKGFFSNSDLV